LAAVAIALLFVSGAVRADDQVIERWYDALLRADRSALAELLSEDARISLDDLDIVQNKEEFLESMDEWESAVAGGTIRHRLEKEDDGVATVIVCYDFPGNRMLMQETFAISEGRITAGSQAEVADTCDAW
jgi:acyl-CoA reductase-like NAD-dependent aldehyde dehydrogenase